MSTLHPQEAPAQTSPRAPHPALCAPRPAPRNAVVPRARGRSLPQRAVYLGIWYPGLSTWYLTPGTRYLVWYLLPGTCHLSPSSWYLSPVTATWYLLLDIWYLVPVYCDHNLTNHN